MALAVPLYLLTGYGIGVALVERWHHESAKCLPWRATAVVFLFAVAWLPILIVDAIQERCFREINHAD